MARAAERFDSWCCQQGWRRQLQPDASRTHWRPFGPRGCPWLVLACLACAALFRALNQKTFRGLIFFPSHRLLCNLIPRQNGLSSPSMVEYLALSSVWKACTCYNFSGLENFFPTNSFPNLIPCQTELSSPGMVEYLALSSVWKACTWKSFSGPEKFFSN